MAEILIIEDDAIMRNMLVQMMEREGYSVQATENGYEAIKLLNQIPFNLVITDIIMPEKEGLEIIMFLKNKLPTIPVIAISGGARISPETYLNLASKFGAKFTFKKPFDRDEFVMAVKLCLDNEADI